LSSTVCDERTSATLIVPFVITHPLADLLMDTGVETAAARFIHPDALAVPANDPIKDPTMKSRLRIAISSSLYFWFRTSLVELRIRRTSTRMNDRLVGG
jgi:hypothetical protein